MNDTAAPPGGQRGIHASTTNLKKENFLKIQQFWKIYLIYVFFLIFKIKSESNRIKSLKLYFSS